MRSEPPPGASQVGALLWLGAPASGMANGVSELTTSGLGVCAVAELPIAAVPSTPDRGLPPCRLRNRGRMGAFASLNPG